MTVPVPEEKHVLAWDAPQQVQNVLWQLDVWASWYQARQAGVLATPNSEAVRGRLQPVVVASGDQTGVTIHPNGEVVMPAGNRKEWWGGLSDTPEYLRVELAVRFERSTTGILSDLEAIALGMERDLASDRTGRELLLRMHPRRGVYQAKNAALGHEVRTIYRAIVRALAGL